MLLSSTSQLGGSWLDLLFNMINVPPYFGFPSVDVGIGVGVVDIVGVVGVIVVGVVGVVVNDVVVVVVGVVFVLQDASTMADTTNKLKHSQITLFFTFALLFVCLSLFSATTHCIHS